MSVEHIDTIEKQMLRIITRYVDQRVSVDRSKLVGQELGVNGSDSIEMCNEIEAMFSVDLRPLIELNSYNLQLSWWERLLGRKVGQKVADTTVGDLIDYVICLKTQRNK